MRASIYFQNSNECRSRRIDWRTRRNMIRSLGCRFVCFMPIGLNISSVRLIKYAMVIIIDFWMQSLYRNWAFETRLRSCWSLQCGESWQVSTINGSSYWRAWYVLAFHSQCEGAERRRDFQIREHFGLKTHGRQWQWWSTKYLIRNCYF